MAETILKIGEEIYICKVQSLMKPDGTNVDVIVSKRLLVPSELNTRLEQVQNNLIEIQSQVEQLNELTQ